MPQSPQASLAAALFADMDCPFLILTAEEGEAITLADDLRSFVGDKVVHFPVLELLPFEVYAHNIELVSARVATLSRLAHGEKILVVACVNAITRRLTPPQVFCSIIIIASGDIFDPEELANRLADMVMSGWR